jgi:hypothetical protein
MRMAFLIAEHTGLLYHTIPFSLQQQVKHLQLAGQLSHCLESGHHYRYKQPIYTTMQPESVTVIKEYVMGKEI